jgi:hypothetical protein
VRARRPGNFNRIATLGVSGVLTKGVE